ncbi:Di-/tripeptide transporter [Actinomyces israelii]|nr:Di-/tripeptide transporter [Actinomyces israelii]
MLNVEMWERFSYYGMRAILLFFITDEVVNGGLGIDDNTGAVILAIYGAAVYLLSIPGGIFADRVIGPWRSALYGGVVIMAGHLCLSTPIVPLAWTGIVLVATGTGFIKPNLSTIVGGLYDQGDPRRDTGFQLFYMSINVGAFASPLVTGWLRAHYGYHAGFAAAAIGMAFALVAFVYGRSKLSAFAFDVPNPFQEDDRRRLLLVSLGAAAAIALAAGALYGLLGSLSDTIAYTTFVIALGASIAYFVIMFRSPKVTGPERTHMRAYISLWVGAVLFWMIYEQASGKMAIFSKSHTDGTTPFGWVISPEAYQSVSPATIVILAPLVGWFFSRRLGRAIPTVTKFATAVLIIGLSALMMGYGFGTWTGGESLAPWWFLAVVFIVQTVGELFLSPVGLSTTTALAPKSFASQAMVLWLLASATGQGLAAVVIANTRHIGDATYYYGLGAATIVVAIAIFAAAPWTQRQMADVDAPGPQ